MFWYALSSAGVVVLLIGLSKLRSGAFDFRRTNLTGCTATEGSVISRDMRRTSIGESARFLLNLRYDYLVCGKMWESQYHYKSRNIRERDWIASLYPPKGKIRVHYDVSNPDRCWIDYFERKRARQQIRFGLSLTAFGVMVLTFGIIGKLAGPIDPNLIYAAISVLCGLALIIFLVTESYGFRPKGQSITDGQVIFAATSESHDEGGTSYYLTVRYEFEVDKTSMRSEDSRSFDAQSERDKIRRLYAVDQKINVHYDPTDPSISWVDFAFVAVSAK